MSPPATHEIESRRATILFADLTGFSAISEAQSPDEAYKIVTGCLRLLDGAARRHGGAVHKWLGDWLMAVFGLPLPSENAPYEASMAALEMRELVHSYRRTLGIELPLDFHVGINTGLVTVGEATASGGGEFRVMGDAVNLAARLKANVPSGAIFVGPETQAATRDQFQHR
ncbi:MAG: adenylate/guanylate cyclase domain-containing protein, partial [Actinobacteria bacterium]|nr:adenylate/guanylate cyclase domain-containing protein [Actinomycetota bacterium]